MANPVIVRVELDADKFRQQLQDLSSEVDGEVRRLKEELSRTIHPCDFPSHIRRMQPETRRKLIKDLLEAEMTSEGEDYYKNKRTPSTPKAVTDSDLGALHTAEDILRGRHLDNPPAAWNLVMLLSLLVSAYYRAANLSGEPPRPVRTFQEAKRFCDE